MSALTELRRLLDNAALALDDLVDDVDDIFRESRHRDFNGDDVRKLRSVAKKSRDIADLVLTIVAKMRVEVGETVKHDPALPKLRKGMK